MTNKESVNAREEPDKIKKEPYFWSNVLPSLCATILAAILAIPAGIAVIKHTNEAAREEKVTKILPQILEELESNHYKLIPMARPTQDKPYRNLNLNIWDYATEGGYLQSVKDQQLILRIANTYALLNETRNLLICYNTFYYYAGNLGKSSSARYRKVQKDLKQTSDQTLRHVKVTIREIENRLKYAEK